LSYARFRKDPISDYFVRLVDIIFGFILAQGFVLYRARIIEPNLSVNSVSLLLVNATVLLSWVGYHRSVNAFPYNATFVSKVRLTFDLLILVVYSYLVFVVEDLSRVLIGLFAVFFLYVVTGVIRTREWHDRKASRLRLSIIIAVAYFLEWSISADGFLSKWSVPMVGEPVLKWTLVLSALGLMLFYRGMRGRRGYPPIVPIGIDIDGVLGEQVIPALTRLQRRGIGVGVTKEHITKWDSQVDNTTIDKAIEEALLDDEYVREMPVIAGSTTAMEWLRDRFHIVIASSRPVEAEAETVKWLKKNFPRCWHEYVNTRVIGKQTLGLKILVDDYPKNAKQFASESGIVLLFSQPWNRDEDDEMKILMRTKKIIRCDDWKAVTDQLEAFLRQPELVYGTE
jgi:5'(3')-deoxyribonucleotidase